MSRRKPARVHGILCIDKPAGLTSRDVVDQAGRLLGERRAGHAGTLDPAATGVLLVAFGEATKAVRWLMSAAKTYETEVEFGAATLTDDAAGPVVREAPVPELTVASVTAALAPLHGWIAQVPPAVSALQHEGVRDHERVRRGEALEREARPVWLGDTEVLGIEGPRLRLQLTCGAGFYVRALARDLGEALGSAAHVATLRRTAAGGFSLDAALTLDDLRGLPIEARVARLTPVETALARLLPVLAVAPEVELQLRQGKHPALPPGAPEQAEALLVVRAADAVPICVAIAAPADAEQGARLIVERGFQAPEALQALEHGSPAPGPTGRDSPAAASCSR